jgi:serine/threonine protein kinase
LIDFNISSIFSENGTFAKGHSNGYAAPEQFGKSSSIASIANSYTHKSITHNKGAFRVSIDERTDIYAMGATIYFLLTGIRPNGLKSLDFTKIKSPTFKKVIKKCMQDNPIQRYQSVEEMRSDLNSGRGFSFTNILSRFNRNEQKNTEVKPVIFVQSESEFSTDKFVPDCEEVDFNDFGNTSKNLANGGIVSTQGKFLYYSNGSSLVKHSLKQNETTTICNDKPNYINVLGNTIYYINSADNKVYSIRTDGHKKKVLIDSECSYLCVREDLLYYINVSDNYTLYKADIQKTFNKQIVNQKCSSYCIFGDRIFFISEDNHFQLASINMYGENFLIHDKRPCGSVLESHGNLFYKAYDGSKYNINLLAKNGTPLVAFNDLGVSEYNVYKSYIYVVADATNGFRLYRKDLKTNEVTPLIKNSICDSINIADEYIFYYDMIEDKIEKITI